MNRTEHLLTILAEECAEVAQRASKALRFGLHEVQPGQPEGEELTNTERIMEEFGDLCAIVDMIRQEGHLTGCRINHAAQMAKKQQRVEDFLLYSKEQGTLSEW